MPKKEPVGPDHPARHDHVPPHKRKWKDPEIKPSKEDEEIDWDAVHDDPGKIVLDDLSGVADLTDDD